MPLAQRIALVVAACGIGGAAFYMFRVGRLRRPSAMVWGGLGLLLLVFAAIPRALAAAAAWFEISPAELMGALAIVYLGVAAVYASVVAADQAARAAELKTTIEDLRGELETLRTELREAQRPLPGQKPRPPSLRT
jgi:cell division protein FtsW (lipid II flippase)